MVEWSVPWPGFATCVVASTHAFVLCSWVPGVPGFIHEVEVGGVVLEYDEEAHTILQGAWQECAGVGSHVKLFMGDGTPAYALCTQCKVNDIMEGCTAHWCRGCFEGIFSHPRYRSDSHRAQQKVKMHHEKCACTHGFDSCCDTLMKNLERRTAKRKAQWVPAVPPRVPQFCVVGPEVMYEDQARPRTVVAPLQDLVTSIQDCIMRFLGGKMHFLSFTCITLRERVKEFHRENTTALHMAHMGRDITSRMHVMTMMAQQSMQIRKLYFGPDLLAPTQVYVYDVLPHTQIPYTYLEEGTQLSMTSGEVATVGKTFGPWINSKDLFHQRYSARRWEDADQRTQDMFHRLATKERMNELVLRIAGHKPACRQDVNAAPGVLHLTHGRPLKRDAMKIGAAMMHKVRNLAPVMEELHLGNSFVTSSAKEKRDACDPGMKVIQAARPMLRKFTWQCPSVQGPCLRYIGQYMPALQTLALHRLRAGAWTAGITLPDTLTTLHLQGDLRDLRPRQLTHVWRGKLRNEHIHDGGWTRPDHHGLNTHFQQNNMRLAQLRPSDEEEDSDGVHFWEGFQTGVSGCTFHHVMHKNILQTDADLFGTDSEDSEQS